jgi:hypothetical protein
MSFDSRASLTTSPPHLHPFTPPQWVHWVSAPASSLSLLGRLCIFQRLLRRASRRMVTRRRSPIGHVRLSKAIYLPMSQSPSLVRQPSQICFSCHCFVCHLDRMKRIVCSLPSLTVAMVHNGMMMQQKTVTDSHDKAFMTTGRHVSSNYPHAASYHKCSCLTQILEQIMFRDHLRH